MAVESRKGVCKTSIAGTTGCGDQRETPTERRNNPPNENVFFHFPRGGQLPVDCSPQLDCLVQIYIFYEAVQWLVRYPYAYDLHGVTVCDACIIKIIYFARSVLSPKLKLFHRLESLIQWII